MILKRPSFYKIKSYAHFKARDTWSNSKLALEYKMKQAKGNGVLTREYTGHGKHSLPTTQEMTLHMDITRWSTPKSD